MVIRTPTGTPTYRNDALIECGSHGDAYEVAKEPEGAKEGERDHVNSGCFATPNKMVSQKFV